MKKVVNVGSAIGTNFLNQLDELSDIREGYERSTLRNSNKELYEILAKVYCIFEDMNKNKSEFESNIKFLKEGLQKSFLRIRHPIKSMAYELLIGEKLSFAEVSNSIVLTLIYQRADSSSKRNAL